MGEPNLEEDLVGEDDTAQTLGVEAREDDDEEKGETCTGAAVDADDEAAAVDDECALESQDLNIDADPYLALSDPYAMLLEDGDEGYVDGNEALQEEDDDINDETAGDDPPLKARRLV